MDVYELEEEEMSNVLRTLAVTYGIDIVVDLLKDMVSPEGVTEFRDKIITLGEELTGKTQTEIDDRVWKYVAQNILTPEGWKKYGGQFVSWAKSYVMNSATKYDDYALPILTSLENAFEN